MIGMPSAVQPYLTGREFVARAEDGAPVGIVRVYPIGGSAGYSTFLKSWGADEGDLLLAQFSLTDGDVVLSLIDDDELEQLSPSL